MRWRQILRSRRTVQLAHGSAKIHVIARKKPSAGESSGLPDSGGECCEN